MKEYYMYFKEKITKEEYEKRRQIGEMIHTKPKCYEAVYEWDDIIKDFRVVASMEETKYAKKQWDNIGD